MNYFVVLVVLAFLGLIGYVIYARHGEEFQASIIRQGLPSSTITAGQASSPEAIARSGPSIVNASTYSEYGVNRVEEINKMASVEINQASYALDTPQRGLLPSTRVSPVEAFSMPVAPADRFVVPATSMTRVKAEPFEVPRSSSRRVGMTNEPVKEPSTRIDFITNDRVMQESASVFDNIEFATA